MSEKTAAVRVLIENRLPGITKDLEGSFAFVTVGTEEGGLKTYLAGERIENEKVIAQLAYSAAEMVKTLGIKKKRATQYGFNFVEAFGIAMSFKATKQGIEMWRDEDEDDDE